MDILNVKDVDKGFYPTPVLKSLTFSIESSGVYGFLGENGSGKTTTLRLLMGLMETESGSNCGKIL